MAFFQRKKYPTLQAMVLGCQRREAQAQRVFYDRYKSSMLGVCRRYAKTVTEAEDIFQEAFVRIFQHIDELRQPDAADSWVKSVIVRTAINYYHRTTRPQEHLTSYDETVDELAADDYELFTRQTDLEALLVIVNQLPDRYRLVINLYLVEDFTHAEIARLLATPEATIRSQYKRAKQMLIKISQQNGLERHEFFG